MNSSNNKHCVVLKIINNIDNDYYKTTLITYK